jgi:hypothetical protein
VNAVEEKIPASREKYSIFLDWIVKFPNSAQNPKISFKRRELAGNSGKSLQSKRNKVLIAISAGI